MGVATFTEELSLKETIKQADDMLYMAKQKGRNRVEYPHDDEK